MNIRRVLAFVIGGVTGLFLTRKLQRSNQKTMSVTFSQKDNALDVAPTNMRRFSEREQKAIQLMINGTNGDYSYLLINVYNDIFYQKKVEFRHGKDKSWLVFYRASMNEVAHNEFLEIENEIMEISLLISYLRGNGLIYLIENTSVNELDSVGGFLKDGLGEILMEIDSNIANILYESLNHRVFVGYTLRDIASNNFKSIEVRTLDEAKRQAEAATIQAQEAAEQTKTAKKQTWLSYLAIFIAIAAIIIGVFSSIWVAKNVVMDVKVDSTQVEAVTRQLNEIGNKVDSLNTTLFLLMQVSKEKQEQTNSNKDKKHQ